MSPHIHAAPEPPSSVNFLCVKLKTRALDTRHVTKRLKGSAIELYYKGRERRRAREGTRECFSWSPSLLLSARQSCRTPSCSGAGCVLERHILKPGLMFKGKGLKPGAFQLRVRGSQRGEPPHRLVPGARLHPVAQEQRGVHRALRVDGAPAL
jgi:hypothetical protein